MSVMDEWLNHIGRVVDIKKEKKKIHEKAFIKNIDVKNKALFLITSGGKELTMFWTQGITIFLYPEETPFTGLAQYYES